MSRFTIPKILFKSLTMITQDYIPNWYPGTHYPKAKFSIAPSQSNLAHTFSLTGATWTILDQEFQDNPNLTKTLSFDKNFPSLGQPEPFRAKKSQDSPNLIKTLSFDRNIT